ncbi:MAG TPA: polyhydroxyalkanoate synthesis repressor PhaR [Alphaproteobacteria bacterium]|nr:polyhydroxyalkanoate synthesis repressor PhaR [Alphaproteobacteria bacterium]
MANTLEAPAPAPITIKKYANRRLYNTATSSYVTLDHLCRMVKDGVDFVVYDAKTGEDITRSVLTQIIVEEEAKGQNLLPISFLKQLIGFYGDNLQFLVPRYLEQAMQSFAHNQEQMRQYMQGTFGQIFPFANLEEMGKQNIALFERTMKMFSPFGQGTEARRDQERRQPEPPAEQRLDDLKTQLEALQRQLDALAKREREEHC